VTVAFLRRVQIFLLTYFTVYMQTGAFYFGKFKPHNILHQLENTGRRIDVRRPTPAAAAHGRSSKCHSSNRATVTVSVTTWTWPLTCGSMHAEQLLQSICLLSLLLIAQYVFLLECGQTGRQTDRCDWTSYPCWRLCWAISAERLHSCDRSADMAQLTITMVPYGTNSPWKVLLHVKDLNPI